MAILVVLKLIYDYKPRIGLILDLCMAIYIYIQISNSIFNVFLYFKLTLFFQDLFVDRLTEHRLKLEDEITVTKKKLEAQQAETKEASQRVQEANSEVEVCISRIQVV